MGDKQAAFRAALDEYCDRRGEPRFGNELERIVAELRAGLERLAELRAKEEEK